MSRPGPLLATRCRKRPSRSFGWVDRRLLFDGYLPRASVDAKALYLFLVLAEDRWGVSFYGPERLRDMTGLEGGRLVRALECLVEADLLVHVNGVYQLLTLPETTQGDSAGVGSVAGQRKGGQQVAGAARGPANQRSDIGETSETSEASGTRRVSAETIRAWRLRQWPERACRGGSLESERSDREGTGGSLE